MVMNIQQVKSIVINQLQLLIYINKNKKLSHFLVLMTQFELQQPLINFIDESRVREQGVSKRENKINVGDNTQGYTKYQFIIQNSKLLLLSKVCSKQDIVITRCIVMWWNGRKLILPSIISHFILRKLNTITFSNPFFYIAKSQELQFTLKIKRSSKQVPLKYLKQKALQVSKNIQKVLIDYYIISDQKSQCVNKKNFFNKKLKALQILLKCKQQTVSILKQEMKNRQEIKKNQYVKQPKNNGALMKQIQAKQQQVLNNHKSQQLFSRCKKYFEFDGIQKIQEFKNQECGQINAQQVEEKKKPNLQKLSNKFQFTNQLVKLINYNIDNKEKNHNENTEQGYHQINETYQTKKVVRKTLFKNLDVKNKKKVINKLMREIQIVKHIKFGEQYFLNYYAQKPKYSGCQPICQQKLANSQVSLYIQYAETPLTFYIDNSLFSLDQIFQKYIDVVKGVRCLQKSGIVHRDLKPSNIMLANFNEENQKTEYRVKIIDFSDSALTSQEFSQSISSKLGYSLPYSPFQCAFDCDFGFNDPKIDVWSLGILIHELFYNNIPNIYVKNVKLQQFYNGIQKNELVVTLNRRCRNKSYLGFLQQIVHLTIMSCLHLKQRDRINLKNLQTINQKIILMIQKIKRILQQ